MTTIVRLVSWTVLVVLIAASGIVAEDDFEIAYDVYRADSCLTAWLDLAPLITSKSVRQLREGVDLAIECRVELATPRRFWGDRSIARAVRYYRLSYREVTSDFQLTTPNESQTHPAVQFGSLAQLYAFLQDSVNICVSPISSLDPDQRAFLSFQITAISLFDINLGHTEADRADSESPIKYMFRQFLRLTDYGRTQHSTRSTEFRIGDLETLP